MNFIFRVIDAYLSLSKEDSFSTSLRERKLHSCGDLRVSPLHPSLCMLFFTLQISQTGFCIGLGPIMYLVGGRNKNEVMLILNIENYIYFWGKANSFHVQVWCYLLQPSSK